MEENRKKQIDYELPLLLNQIVLLDQGPPAEGKVVLTWDQILRVQEFLYPHMLPNDKRAKTTLVLRDTVTVVTVDFNWMSTAFLGYINWKKRNQRLFFTPMN